LSQSDVATGLLSDGFINIALTYLFKKAAAEVKEFNPKKTIDKIAVEQDHVLFSKNRLVDEIC
jgi:sulfur transfer protein SufE